MTQQQIDKVLKMCDEYPKRNASALAQDGGGDDDESVSSNNNAGNNFGSHRGKSGKNSKRHKKKRE